MAGPAIRDLALYRGDDYSHQITFIDESDPPESIDLSDYTFKAQIRDRPQGSNIVLATFDIDISQAGDGIIVLSLSAAGTQISSGYWDLEVDNGSSIQTWLRGFVEVSGDVTKVVGP